MSRPVVFPVTKRMFRKRKLQHIVWHPLSARRANTQAPLSPKPRPRIPADAIAPAPPGPDAAAWSSPHSRPKSLACRRFITWNKVCGLPPSIEFGMHVPAEILANILSRLGGNDLKASRLVCQAWESNATLLLFASLPCPDSAAGVQFLRTSGSWSCVRRISADWPLAQDDALLAQLETALATVESISIGRAPSSCRCHDCQALYNYDKTVTWKVLSALSFSRNAQVHRLAISLFIHDSVGFLPKIQDLMPEKPEYLVDLSVSCPGESGLTNFLSACTQLKTLCLRINSFKDLDDTTMGKLEAFRVQTHWLDNGPFCSFFDRHQHGLRVLVVLVTDWWDVHGAFPGAFSFLGWEGGFEIFKDSDRSP